MLGKTLQVIVFILLVLAVTFRNQFVDTANNYEHKSFALAHGIKTDWLCQPSKTGHRQLAFPKTERDKSEDYWRVLASTGENYINKNS